MLTTRTRTRLLPAVLVAALLAWGGPAWAANDPTPTPTPAPPGTTITPPGDSGGDPSGYETKFGVDTPGSGGSGSGGGTSGGCKAPAGDSSTANLPYSCSHACWYVDFLGQGGAPPGQQKDWTPSPENPIDGHTDGKYVQCKYFLDNGMVMTSMRGEAFWIGPGGEAAVDPAVLAQQAMAAMALRTPEIGMTGGSPPDGMQIVGVPAWLWAADPGESTTPGVAGVAPITRSASAGGVTVEATGRLDRTVWSMGDGTTVTCPGTRAAGTPWRYGYGGQPSPTCGHTYQRTSAGQPGEAFTVTVTAYWTITWSGGGQSGTLSVQRSRSIQKRVGEIQAILVPGPGT